MKVRKHHEFLGIVLYFGLTPGGVHVIQTEYVSDLVNTFRENVKCKVVVPASSDLFQRGDGELLSKELRILFHPCLVKGIFILKYSRPDTSLVLECYLEECGIQTRMTGGSLRVLWII